MPHVILRVTLMMNNEFLEIKFQYLLALVLYSLLMAVFQTDRLQSSPPEESRATNRWLPQLGRVGQRGIEIFESEIIKDCFFVFSKKLYICSVGGVPREWSLPYR